MKGLRRGRLYSLCTSRGPGPIPVSSHSRPDTGQHFLRRHRDLCKRSRIHSLSEMAGSAVLFVCSSLENTGSRCHRRRLLVGWLLTSLSSCIPYWARNSSKVPTSQRRKAEGRLSTLWRELLEPSFTAELTQCCCVWVLVLFHARNSNKALSKSSNKYLVNGGMHEACWYVRAGEGRIVTKGARAG
jgi:hypothetical protein